MGEIIGAQTILANGIPTGVDGTRLATWRMRDGRTWREHLGALALVIAEKNRMMADKWGDLFGITDDIMVEYEQGGSVTKADKITDVSDITAISGETIGHMIDLFDYGTGIGGSSKYFRDGRAMKFASDINTAIRKLEWRWEYNLLNRFFVNTEYAVGSAGYNVPFVRGTGGNVDYAPPAFAGEAFTTSHDHFVGFDSGSKDMEDVLNGLAETLIEHGHSAPFTAIVSKTDVDAGTFLALSKFVEFKIPVAAIVDRGGASSGNQFYANGQFAFEGTIGYFQSIYGQITLRMSARVPTGYVGMYKSYGMRDQRNPLWVRVHPNVGFGIRVVPETTNDNQWPLKQVNFTFEFEVGVGADRTNGAVGYLVSGGTYANATIS